jgi:FKBP-type peptidyl-prolyl cis-trans isomerase
MGQTFLGEFDIADEEQQTAYLAGYLHMKTLLRTNDKFVALGFTQGLYDALANQPMKAEKSQLVNFAQWRELTQLNMEALKKIPIKPGERFLESNKQQPEVKSLSSGLQYRIIKEGKGNRHPKITDTTLVYFQLKTIAGNSLNKDEQPAKTVKEVPVTRFPKGIQEALQLMTEGSEWLMFLPAHLAYGENGALISGILPNETLICNLELVKISAGK